MTRSRSGHSSQHYTGGDVEKQYLEMPSPNFGGLPCSLVRSLQGNTGFQYGIFLRNTESALSTMRWVSYSLRP